MKPPTRILWLWSGVFFLEVLQYTYQHLPRGAKWFRYRVSIHHPLGFTWHPFEGASIIVFICNIYIYIIYIYILTALHLSYLSLDNFLQKISDPMFQWLIHRVHTVARFKHVQQWMVPALEARCRKTTRIREFTPYSHPKIVFQGTVGCTPNVRVLPWYLLCFVGILGDYNYNP